MNENKKDPEMKILDDVDTSGLDNLLGGKEETKNLFRKVFQKLNEAKE